MDRLKTGRPCFISKKNPDMIKRLCKLCAMQPGDHIMNQAESESKLSGILKTLGPGILLAGAAIGGSHVVQSTRAGAMYGFNLIWIIILVNLFKYPFFEFVYRYHAATGKSILEGYGRVSRFMLGTVIVIIFFSGVLNIAALSVAAAGLAANLIGSTWPIGVWVIIVCMVCLSLLFIGKYPVLDKVIKVIVALLAITTVLAVIRAVFHGSNAEPGYVAPPVWNAAGIAFMLGIMGWMPAPIDVAIWPSIWAQERQKQTGHKATLQETMFDFHLGYLSTAILALGFLAMGALVMFGTGEDFAPSGTGFAAQLVRLYTDTLGGWTFYIVATAAFTCIFSSTLTCFDGYPLALERGITVFFNKEVKNHRLDPVYWGGMLFYAAATLIITFFFLKGMVYLLHFAAIIAFITAPLMAAFNFLVIYHKDIPENYRPPKWLGFLSLLGLIYLTGFTLAYLYTLIPRA
jgi:Mn2+/Fe2+ NRAMP family transporter